MYNYIALVFSLFALMACGSIVPKSPAIYKPNNSIENVEIADTVNAVNSTENLPDDFSEEYSVVVEQVPVEQLLLALARDAKINFDVKPGLRGLVTLNAVDQTLPQILERIAEQVDMRYEIDRKLIRVGPDTPFVKSYAIDYVNMTRKLKANVSISTSIATVGSASASQSGIGNASSSEVINISENELWNVLRHNVDALLRQPDSSTPSSLSSSTMPTQPETSLEKPSLKEGRQEEPSVNPLATRPDALAAKTLVILNAEAGLLTVNATGRQHKRVSEYLDRVRASIGRQVLIEATLVEVILDKSYQSGVDWARIGDSLQNTLNINQSLTGNAFGSGPVTTLTLQRTGGLFGGTLNATVKLLETFGTTRVLSSPKVMALNNQTALLKVVDEKVYFEIAVQRVDGTANTAGRVDYTTTIKSVPIGVMMSVTPQISLNGEVLLNIRPTITRITSYKADPAISLLGAKVDNLIPEIQVREIESTLKLASGQAVVLGGLMQESTDDKKQGIPLLMHLPFIGDLFAYRNDGKRKTELVIFLRPTVISLDRASQAQERLSYGDQGRARANRVAGDGL